MREMLMIGFLLADMFIGFYGIDRIRVRRSLGQEAGGGTTSDVRVMDDMYPPPH